MMNVKIIVIDDKIENFEQVKRSLLDINNLEFIHIKNYNDFFDKVDIIDNRTIIIQDFFLEQWKTAVDLINRFKQDYSEKFNECTFVGFSSIENCSKRISEMTGSWLFLKKNKEALEDLLLKEIILNQMKRVERLISLP